MHHHIAACPLPPFSTPIAISTGQPSAKSSLGNNSASNISSTPVYSSVSSQPSSILHSQPHSAIFATEVALQSAASLLPLPELAATSAAAVITPLVRALPPTVDISDDDDEDGGEADIELEADAESVASSDSEAADDEHRELEYFRFTRDGLSYDTNDLEQQEEQDKYISPLEIMELDSGPAARSAVETRKRQASAEVPRANKEPPGHPLVHIIDFEACCRQKYKDRPIGYQVPRYASDFTTAAPASNGLSSGPQQQTPASGEEANSKMVSSNLVPQVAPVSQRVTVGEDRLSAVITDILHRLNRQGILADPRDVCRAGGGRGGDYYDNDESFFDDEEAFRDLGLTTEDRSLMRSDDSSSESGNSDGEDGGDGDDIGSEVILYSDIACFTFDCIPSIDDTPLEEIMGTAVTTTTDDNAIPNAAGAGGVIILDEDSQVDDGNHTESSSKSGLASEGAGGGGGSGENAPPRGPIVAEGWVKSAKWRKFADQVPTEMTSMLEELEVELRPLGSGKGLFVKPEEVISVCRNHVHRLFVSLYPKVAWDLKTPATSAAAPTPPRKSAPSSKVSDLVSLNWEGFPILATCLQAMTSVVREAHLKRWWTYRLVFHNQGVYDALEDSICTTIVRNLMMSQKRGAAFFRNLKKSVDEYLNEIREIRKKARNNKVDADNLMMPSLDDFFAKREPEKADAAKGGCQKPTAPKTSAGDATATAAAPTVSSTKRGISSSPFTPVAPDLVNWGILFNARKHELHQVGEALEEWAGAFTGWVSVKFRECWLRRCPPTPTGQAVNTGGVGPTSGAASAVAATAITATGKSNKLKETWIPLRYMEDLIKHYRLELGLSASHDKNRRRKDTRPTFVPCRSFRTLPPSTSPSRQLPDDPDASSSIGGRKSPPGGCESRKKRKASSNTLPVDSDAAVVASTSATVTAKAVKANKRCRLASSSAANPSDLTNSTPGLLPHPTSQLTSLGSSSSAADSNPQLNRPNPSSKEELNSSTVITDLSEVEASFLHQDVIMEPMPQTDCNREKSSAETSDKVMTQLGDLSFRAASHAAPLSTSIGKGLQSNVMKSASSNARSGFPSHQHKTTSPVLVTPTIDSSDATAELATRSLQSNGNLPATRLGDGREASPLMMTALDGGGSATVIPRSSAPGLQSASFQTPPSHLSHMDQPQREGNASILSSPPGDSSGGVLVIVSESYDGSGCVPTGTSVASSGDDAFEQSAPDTSMAVVASNEVQLDDDDDVQEVARSPLFDRGYR